MFDVGGSWVNHYPLIKFSYNNNHRSSIGMDLFKALYGRMCRYPIGWFEVDENKLFDPKLVHQAIEKVKVIRDRLNATQSCQ